MLRSGYTVVKTDGHIAYYRGALRIDRGAVVWECPHEHKWGASAARRCAEDYFEALDDQERRPARPTGDAEQEPGR